MVERMSGGGALRALRLLDDPKDVEAVAAFVKKNPSGGFALNLLGKEGVDAVKHGSEEAILLGAKKGRKGIAWGRSGHQGLMRPHFLVGVVKGIHKGKIPRFISALADSLDRAGKWIIAFVCAWIFAEAFSIANSFRAATRLARQRNSPVSAALAAS